MHATTQNFSHVALGTRPRVLRPPSARGVAAVRSDARRSSLLATIVLILGGFWTLLTLPFRLFFGTFIVIGRIAGLVVGFTLMVLGAAVCAAPFLIFGVPMFLVGLLLTLKNLN